MKINGFISTMILTVLLLIATLGGITHAENEEAWMTDPNLRWFVRERLEIPDHIPMTPQDLLRLKDLEIRAKDLITNLQGLEYAVNLEFLNIEHSNISDLTPLAGLQNIRILKFYDGNISDLTPLTGLANLTDLNLSQNNISDLTPLTGLVNLRYLSLAENNISDITPLDGLVNLKVLILGGNQIIDFAPLNGLVGIETLDLGQAGSEIPIDSEILQRLKPVEPPVICEIARDPIRPRIENRGYPSVFQACGDIINLPRLSWEEGIAYHDLFFCRETFGWTWTPTPDGNLRLIGDREEATIGTDRMRAQNPNLLLLTSIEYYVAGRDEYPEDWPYWLRDESGNILEIPTWDQYKMDFTHPAVQEMVIQQAIEVAKCGVFDGIAIDHWTKEIEGYITMEEADTARERIMKGIRDAVGDDFLILITTTDTKIPKTMEYINGLFMETTEDYEGGYTYEGLSHIENTLLWAEKNLREPQINCLAGRGVRSEPLDSPRNIQWMRLWTTMSLTHSDGYVMFTMGGNLDHPPHSFEFWPGHAEAHAQGKRHSHQNTKYWYDFYGAPLGQPIGDDETKGQLYENIEGLFIREFTNGWAVYNRSGKEQQVEFSEAVSGVASAVKDKRSHILPDLDGEIYLKTVVKVEPGKYPPLYWINAKANTLQRLVDTEVKNLVSEIQNATSLTVDTANGKLYWTEKTSNRTGKIQRANLDGTNIQLVKDLTSAPLDIALNTVGEKLYLSNAWGKIQRMNLDGSNFQPNLITGLMAPQNIVLDSMEGKLYWTEQTGQTTGKIQSANLDGNSNVQLVKELTSAPRGMTLDAVNRKLYLTNGWGKLQRMNFDGANFESNLITGLASPGQVAVDVVGGKVYWTEKGKLRRADLNGENIQDVVTGLGELTDLDLGIDSVGEMGVAAAPAIRRVVEQTQLLANYPNPFNPETWIPYHLANPSDVRITIYDARGTVIRHLDLGHQPQGYYTSQSRAAYWDGRNVVGERVASGVYFYQLQADNVSLLRKMIIVK